MREFLGYNGNTAYIISSDYNEAMSFNSYGFGHSILTADSATSNCTSVRPVDILSLLGTLSLGKEYSEIYFQGKSAKLPLSYLKVFSALRGKLNNFGGKYFSRKGEGFNQVIIPLEKNSISHSKLEEMIGYNLNWSSLQLEK